MPPDKSPVSEVSNSFRMQADASAMKFTNLSALVFGMLLLSIYLLMRGLFDNFTLLGGAVLIVAYAVIDYLIWRKQGIRCIEIDQDGINFYKGKRQQLI